MRILIAVPSDELGGAEQYLKNIARYYLREGNHVDVYFLTESKFFGWKDLQPLVNLRLFFPKATKERRGFLALANFVRKNNLHYDFSFSSHVHLNFLLALLRKIRILKTSYLVGRESTTVHERFRSLKVLPFNFAYHTFYKYLDLLICQSDVMKDSLVKNVPRLKDALRIVVLKNPIDLDDISRRVAVAQHKVKNLNFIVSAGRLIPEKGFDILIEAFSQLKSSNLVLIILGKGKEDALLKQIVEKRGLVDKVLFPGFSNDVYSYFKFAKVCVVSSRIEGFPNVLLQMMAANPRVVSTTCAGGIEDIPGVYLAIPSDISSLKEALENALSANTDTDIKVHKAFNNELLKRDIGVFIKNIYNELQTNF